MKRDVMKAVRSYCLGCCCEQPKEVRLCVDKNCPLYPFRMGKDPNARKRSKRSTNDESSTS